MESIEEVVARAERLAIEEWEREHAPPPPWMEGVDTSFRAEIIRTHLGYRAEHIGWGMTELANCWPFAFTRKGIHRKLERIRRRYERKPEVTEIFRGF